MRYVVLALALIVSGTVGVAGSSVFASFLKGVLRDSGDPSLLEWLAVVGGGFVGGISVSLWLLQRFDFL